jgi:hypothetical protein
MMVASAICPKLLLKLMIKHYTDLKIGKLNLSEVNHLLRLSLFSHTAEFNDRGETTDIPGDIPGSGHAHHLEMGY